MRFVLSLIMLRRGRVPGRCSSSWPSVSVHVKEIPFLIGAFVLPMRLSRVQLTRRCGCAASQRSSRANARFSERATKTMRVLWPMTTSGMVAMTSYGTSSTNFMWDAVLAGRVDQLYRQAPTAYGPRDSHGAEDGRLVKSIMD